MTLARLPLTFPIQSRSASTSKDSRVVNAVFESRTDKQEVVKRPGLVSLPLSPTIAAGQGQGLFYWNGYLVAGVNNNLYLIQGTTVTSLGTVTGNQLPFSFTTVANDVKLAFHNGSNLYAVSAGSPPIFNGGVGLSGIVSSVVINNGGGFYGYVTPVTITVGATTTVNLTSHGLVVGQGVTFTGTLPTGMVVGTTYQVGSVPTGNTFTINTATDAGGVGTAVATSGTSSGVNVLASPTVTFSASPGVTAVGVATLFNHQVSGVIITTHGTGYTAAPTITFSSPPVVTQSPVISSMVWGVSSAFGGTWTILSINLSSNGAGYLTAPIINFTDTFTPVNGTTPSGYAVIDSNGTITGINLTAGGNWYGQEAYVHGVSFPSNPSTLSYSYTLPLISISISAPVSTIASATVVMASSGITGPFAAGIAYLDGKCYVMDTKGRVYDSNTDDPTTWPGTYLQASSDPDGGVGLIRHLNYLVAFGQWSTEFFYDAGNTTGSPLAVNQAAKIEIGCANGYSIAGAEQTVLWVGQSLTDGRCVYLLDGLSPTKISTRYIEKYLNAASMLPLASGASSVRSYCFKNAGHTLYVLSLIDLNLTLVYDLDEQQWYQWSSQTGDNGVINSGTESYFSPTAYEGELEATTSGVYLQDDQNGLIYRAKTNVYNDNGNHIYMRVVAPNADSGTNKRKFYQRAEVIGDKVTGTGYVRHSDDDYKTWSTYRSVDLSQDRPVLYQNGAARRRAWEVFVSDDIPVRLEAMEFEFEVGETGT